MGRVCAVPGCNSGTVKDLMQKKFEGVRKNSLFQVPKDIQQRQFWSDEFGKQFGDTDTICELHFYDQDLYNNDDILVINGERIVSVRQRVTLKKNAVPRRNVVEMEKETEFCVNKINKDYSIKFPQAPTEKLTSNTVSEYKIKRSNGNISQEFKGCDVITSNYEDDNQMDIEYGFSNEMSNNDFSNIDSQSSTTDRGFGITNLVGILKKSHLKQNWSWGEKDGDIFFSLFDLYALSVRCYLQVHSNMKLTIFLCDKQKLVNFTGITEIKSFEDLTELLQCLEGQKLCLGTGLSQNGRSETCSIANKFDRCSFCMKEKQKIEKHRLFIEDKHKVLLKSYNSLKKKAEYCRKKLKEARELIAKLGTELDNAERNAQNKLLEGLPSIQREIIGMFIKFASKDKNRFRYDSYDWICECLAMYTKSCSLYKYMRDRGILPLPSPSTLKTQQKKLATALTDSVLEKQQEL